MPVYWDLSPSLGLPGIGAAWSRARRPCVALFVDTGQGRPCMLATMLEPGRDLAGAARDLVAPYLGPRPMGPREMVGCRPGSRWPPPEVREPRTERLALQAAFPHARAPRGEHDPLGPLPDRRAAALAALGSVPLPDAMRRAMLAVLDHGPVPSAFPMGELRAFVGGPAWDVVAFLAEHPSLYRAILSEEVGKDLAGGTDVREAVRRRSPALTDAVLRRFRAGSPGEPSFHLDAMTVRALETFPADWLPVGEAWRDLVAVTEAASVLACAQAGDAGDLVRPCKGDWPAFHARCRAAVRADPTHRSTNPVRDASRDAHDPIRALARQLLLPLMTHLVGDIPEAQRTAFAEGAPISTKANRRSVRFAARLLLGGKGLPAALETSRRWHAAQQAIDSAIVAPGPATWEPLLHGPVALPGGVTATCVHDSESLVAEGATGIDGRGVEGLSHCVGSRLSLYRSGRAHLVSFRHDHGTDREVRLSCAELRVLPDRGGGHAARVEVVEHRGVANSVPPSAASGAMNALAGMIEDGSLDPNPASLTPPPGAAADHVAELCGYDWRDPEAVMAAYRSWSPLLPRWARGHGLPGLAETLASRGILPPNWRALVFPDRHIVTMCGS